MGKIIEVKNFSKSFGSKRVVSDLNFEVETGELFAFLGPNGSGKTTTIRCLLDIYQADSGTLLIDGLKYSTSMAGLIGYLPEERGLYNNSKVLETMIYFGQIKGMSRNDAKTQAIAYLERVGIGDKVNDQIKRLSSGQQQKVQLGITIINSPRILILDEPTKGLDPVNRKLLLDILEGLNQKTQTTILFSTHQMDEVEKIADRLLMLKDGRNVLYGPVTEVKKQFGENILHIDFSGKFPQNPKLYTTDVERNHAEVKPCEGISDETILKFLIDAGLDLKSFTTAAPSLDEIFIKVAKE